MKWISLRELVLVHGLVINETGGVHGVINPAAFGVGPAPAIFWV